MQRESVLRPWMRFVLKFAGVYNVVAGLLMIVAYHEGYRALAIAKPQLVLPIQLVGMMVALFGVGYWIVALHPVENRNILLMGFLSKLLGPLLAMMHVAEGDLPWTILPVLFFADLIYLVPFWIIYRRLRRFSITLADIQCDAS